VEDLVFGAGELGGGVVDGDGVFAWVEGGVSDCGGGCGWGVVGEEGFDLFGCVGEFVWCDPGEVRLRDFESCGDVVGGGDDDAGEVRVFGADAAGCDGDVFEGVRGGLSICRIVRDGGVRV
jgi:hypothetical protein